jgi:hypothetical protein
MGKIAHVGQGKWIAIPYPEPFSRIVETYLREHPMVKKEVDIIRSEPNAEASVANPGSLAGKYRKV